MWRSDNNTNKNSSFVMGLFTDMFADYETLWYLGVRMSVLVSRDHLTQGFSTSGSRPHLGSPSDFRGVAELSTNFLKNDGIFKY